MSKQPDRFLEEEFSIGSDFQRFNQKNDIFSRSSWDESVNPKDFYTSYDVTNFKPKKSEGFDHWDFALRNASWHLADFLADQHQESQGFNQLYQLKLPGPSEPIQLDNPADTTKRIKKAAHLLGAAMVGICKIDWRWIYSHRFERSTNSATDVGLSPKLSYAIVLISPMDQSLSEIVPSAIGGASTGLGYAQSIQTANALAQFITNLGFEAEASLNDTALAIPLAIQAGLGEYGRNGLLITPKYGPRVRISKVFTDIPLLEDQPIQFGVKQFCQQCDRCASACPVRAIPNGPPQSEPPNFSSLSHITKWTINAEKCFSFWANMNTDCAICIRVCPYNKDYSKWWNRIGIRLAGTFLRGFMLWLDKKLGFGKRKKPAKWWKKKRTQG